MDILQALEVTTAAIKSWADENKVQKIKGKGLSTNDYTDEDKNKVAQIGNIPNDLVIRDDKLYLAQNGVIMDDSAVTLPSGGTFRYNVYFYNGEELLYVAENVPYGGSASYVGSTPVKSGVTDPDDYIFKGWSPLPETITGDTYCYALFKFAGYLFGKLGKADGEDYGYGTVDNPNWDTINAYWDTIAADVMSYQDGILSEEDFIAKYPIGGRMVVPINLADGATYVDVEIIGHNHDNFADGSGKAPLTFFCADLPQISHCMNEDNTNAGGYESSAMRTFLNGELFNALPSNLRAIIKSVYKISDCGSTNKELVTTIDSCWLASCDEVGLIRGDSDLSEQGELYSSVFSSDKESRKKYIIGDTVTGGWWLRTSYCSKNSNSMFWRITNSGGNYSDIAFNNFYVAFGFCVSGVEASLGTSMLGKMILGRGD